MANTTNNEKVKNYVNFEIVWKNGDKTSFSVDMRKHAYTINGGYIKTVIRNDDGTVPQNPTVIGLVNLAETRTVKTYLS